MGNFRIPTPIAVAAWAASALAVLSYTYLAYKETSHGETPTPSTPLSARQAKRDSKGLISQLPELPPLQNETPVKPLVGRRFKNE